MNDSSARMAAMIRLVHSFLSSGAGGIGPFMAIGMLVLTVGVGVAVDTGRGYLVKSHLSQALDAAGLAGGRAVFAPTRDSDITMFFNANYPAGYMSSTVSGPQIAVDANKEVITLSAIASVPTTFMRIVGIDKIDVVAQSVVRRSNRGMELVLVMDNTGSMTGSKITAMKAAAADLINILYGASETLPNFWVGLVPYVATVNIGNTRTNWLVPGSLVPANYSPGAWKGCVEARASPYEEDQAEALPVTRGWKPFFWASNKSVVYRDGKNKIVPPDNPWPTITETVAAGNNAQGPNLGCGPPITSLQPSKATALSAIAAMGPWSRGGTMGNLGLAWGWRMLSPAWRGMWGGATPADMPFDYHTPYMDKVIVMLTDGVNEWYDWPDHAPGCAGIAAPCTFPDADYTAYGRLSEARLGTTNNATATTIINNRMTSLCTAMKNQGVIIYTIVLQVNDTATQNLYRNCASKPEYYFLSPSPNDLAAIFQAIATQLSNLRLAR